MKTLAASNRHLSTASARKTGVERNVRSSSAVEGVSKATFRSAVSGRFNDGGSKAPRVNERAKKK